jgi:hypothetical protein
VTLPFRTIAAGGKYPHTLHYPLAGSDFRRSRQQPDPRDRRFLPTLARIAGGKVPADRPMDGVDQLDFFTARQEKSNREHVLLFLGQKLIAVKWRNYKLHLDGLDRVDGAFEDWSFPRAFNLASDPKERFNIIWQNTWLGDEIGPFAAAYESSVRKYPNLAGGQPNDQIPCYGAENANAETGTEGVQRKLETMKEH